MAEGIDDIEAVALAEGGETAGAVADNLDEQAQRPGLGVDVVHRDGTAQHDAGLVLDEYLDKLAGGYGLHLAAMLQHQTEVLVAELLARSDTKGVYFLHYCCFDVNNRLKKRFHEAASKSDESVVACRVRKRPMGSMTKDDIHMPMGPIADSRTAFSAIMPTT